MASPRGIVAVSSRLIYLTGVEGTERIQKHVEEPELSAIPFILQNRRIYTRGS